MTYKMEKALVKIIFGCKIFICQLFFEIFMALFKTSELQKDDIKRSLLLEVFQSKVICKMSVSKGWRKESSCVFVIIMG